MKVFNILREVNVLEEDCKKNCEKLLKNTHVKD